MTNDTQTIIITITRNTMHVQDHSNMAHQSVLLQEFLTAFQGVQIHSFVDATLGAGGHSLALLQQHPEIQTYIAIDQDETALQIAAKRLCQFESKIVYFKGNFAQLETALLRAQVNVLDGIFFDLGVSSMQLDCAEKGFSFRSEGPLDMRMDRSESLTAEIIVNQWSEKDLADLIYEYGEETKSYRAARLIVEARKKKKLETTTDLARVLSNLYPQRPGRKFLHPATLTFQALRIYINQELKVLRQVLPFALDKLRAGGRMGVISFHSLEDRIVKHFFKEREFRHKQKRLAENTAEAKAMILTKKPIIPSPQEVEINPRSRSAKLRLIEKV